MFRAKILQPLFEKSKTNFFRPGQAEEDVKTRFNTEYCKEYYDNYGFYDYEIWNVDFTFACFMYTHLKALIEFQERAGQKGEFEDHCKELCSKVEGLIVEGYDFWKDEDIERYKDICKEFVEMIPGMWT